MHINTGEEKLYLNVYDSNNNIVESESFVNFNKDYVNLDNAEVHFVTLKILNEQESKRLCDILKKYNGNRMRADIFTEFLDSQGKTPPEKKQKKQKNEFEEEETFEGDNAGNMENNEDDEDFDYDGERLRPKLPMNKTIQLLKQKLEDEYISKLKRNISF